MTREEQIQEQMEDLQRGLDSITVDAFQKTKEYLQGRYHHLSPVFRKWYHRELEYCRKYMMKSKNGARYRLVTFDDMFNFYMNRRG